MNMRKVLGWLVWSLKMILYVVVASCLSLTYLELLKLWNGVTFGKNFSQEFPRSSLLHHRIRYCCFMLFVNGKEWIRSIWRKLYVVESRKYGGSHFIRELLNRRISTIVHSLPLVLLYGFSCCPCFPMGKSLLKLLFAQGGRKGTFFVFLAPLSKSPVSLPRNEPSRANSFSLTETYSSYWWRRGVKYNYRIYSHRTNIIIDAIRTAIG